MKKYDVIVIGNGILGLSLAYFLKKFNPSVSVALVGSKKREGCATLAAGAMINLWAEITPGQFENPALADRFELARLGAELWDNFALEIANLSGDDIKIKKGTYLLRTLRSTELEDKNFAYIKDSMKKFNVEHRSVCASELKWLKPSQCSRTLEAVWLPDGRVDTRKVISSLDSILSYLKVDVYESNASDVSPTNLIRRSDTKVTLEDGTKILGRDVVLANGAYAQKLIDKIPSIKKVTPRLLYGIGSGADLSFSSWTKKWCDIGEIVNLDAVVRTTDRGGACGVHIVPHDQPGSFYAGASSLSSVVEDDINPRLASVHILLESVMYEVNRSLFHAGVTLRSNGYRPTSADCFPLIGQTSVPNIWMLNGTKRDGFTMAPHIAQELAKSILGMDSNLPKRFQPTRKLISYKTKEVAIKDAELMYIGADYTHGGRVATYMADQYLEMRNKVISSVYKTRGIDNFGIHPELLHLYENNEFYKLIKHNREREHSNDRSYEYSD